MLGTALAYIALAFFIARISLAAAIAAGDACLSGGAGRLPAPLLAPAAPRPAPVRAQGPRPTRFLKGSSFQILLEITALPPFNNTNSLRACQHRRAGQTDEQPVLDNARVSRLSSPARRGASLIRPRWASTIQWPPSVTKTWPSLPFRTTICPETPLSANALPMARCVAARPNGITSTGSGKRPSASTHLVSSAITIMRSDAAATIFRATARRRRP